MLSKSQVKYIQSLGQKKFRDQSGLFIAEGPKIIAELIAALPDNIVTVYALDNWINENLKLKTRFEIESVNENELARISQLSTPNTVVAIIKKREQLSNISSKNKVTIALDTIQDPGNFGTIVRIADWFGISQIVATTESADIYNPKVVQSTMGSIARVQVVYTDLKKWLGQQTVKIYAAALDGKDINNLHKIEEGIVIVGNEGKGINEEILSLATETITIPKIGHAESLNAAVATGIILSRLA